MLRMEQETTMTLPTPAIRNAIAFVDFFGTFASGTHMSSRLAAQRWEDGDYVWVRHCNTLDQRVNRCIRFYNVTDAGREVAAKGALAKSLAWLAQEGFTFEGTRSGKLPKVGYIHGFRHEDGREAWISNSQSDTSGVYVNLPRSHPDYTIGSQLKFTGKAG
jgi:hypothetical protein